MSLFRLLAFSAILRLGLIVYGSWHDSNFKVKYTDIDYIVFSDAARHVMNGTSPYNRATYRYTPLLAILMTPNSFLHPCFGKFFFSICDLVIVWFIIMIIKEERSLDFHNNGTPPSEQLNVDVSKELNSAACLWLLNPFSLTISTRGNAESFQAILVLATILFVIRKRYLLGGMCFGLAIHFKIYPIIYSLPILLYILKDHDFKFPEKWSLLQILDAFACLSKALLSFTFVSGLTLLAVTSLFFARFQMEFIEHTYLYHMKRTDIKHNFSPYFYVLYLTSETPWSLWIGILAFLPQAISVAAFGIKYHRRLSVACFFQTFAFVTFNKVCTSQYFLWYLSLLPIAMGYLKLDIHYDGPLMVFIWMSAQGVWLFLAYLLEFKGLNTFFLVWMASIWFFLVNIYIILKLMSSVFLKDSTYHVASKTKKIS